MACLEYSCAACGWGDVTNSLIRHCPRCGGALQRFFDEEGDHDYEGAEDEDEEAAEDEAEEEEEEQC